MKNMIWIREIIITMASSNPPATLTAPPPPPPTAGGGKKKNSPGTGLAPILKHKFDTTDVKGFWK